MRHVFLVLLAASTILFGVFLYERVVVESMFGPTSMLAATFWLFSAVFLLASYILYGTRYRELVARTWLVSVSVVGTYLIADLMAGALLIQSLSPQLTPDDVRHHRLIANAYSKFEQQDFSYVQRVNSLGLRGEDVEIDKPPDTFRILMLGDSFTMGKGVEDDETFSALLERRLNESSAQYCDSKRIQVINAGVDSYAPILSYLHYVSELSALSPDMVILNLDVSDLIQEAAYRAEAIYDENGLVVAVPGSERRQLLNQRIRTWIDQNLYFSRLILFYANRLMGYRDLTVRGVVTQASYDTVLHTLQEDTVDRTVQWLDVFESIARLRDAADRDGVRFLLTIYPWGHQVGEHEWVPGRSVFMPAGALPSNKSAKMIESLSRERGIELLDLTPRFRAYAGGRPLYFRHDPHWTPEGHGVMAEGLLEYLLGSHLDGSCDQSRQ